jgi:hypothetical protein
MAKGDEERARVLAEIYVQGLNLRGWEYRFVGVKPDADGTWGAVFDTYSPEGNLCDGPVVFVVDLESATVQGLEGYIMSRSEA